MRMKSKSLLLLIATLLARPDAGLAASSLPTPNTQTGPKEASDWQAFTRELPPGRSVEARIEGQLLNSSNALPQILYYYPAR
jgi:hypothetical protein